MSKVKLITRISTISILINIGLFIVKLISGLLSGSYSMISDAVHSLTDIISTLIVMTGVFFSEKAADKDHPYGHERIECIVALGLAVILCFVGCGIGYNGFHHLLRPPSATANTYMNYFAVLAACISIFSKEWMYHYTRHAAIQIHSGALMADAWHHRSDALSSIGSFIGILGLRMGFPVVDAVACILICAFIIQASCKIAKEAIDNLIDKSCSKEFIQKLAEAAISNNAVQRIDTIKTRRFASKVYVDMEFSVDGNITLAEAHTIASQIHDNIEQNYPDVKHCMIHINPYSNRIHHHI